MPRPGGPCQQVHQDVNDRGVRRSREPNAAGDVIGMRDACAEAKRGGYDGVICGHIHSAAIRDLDGIAYVNTGDWVESCTAVVELEDGRLALIDWEHTARKARHRDRARRARRRQRQLENV